MSNMFERFRKKKEPEIIIHKYEFIPYFKFEGATREEVIAYLKSLSRVQLLHFSDTIDLDAIETELDLWDIYYDVLNGHGCWPTDDEVSEALKKLYWNNDSLYHKYTSFDENYVKQIVGIQKKLDRIQKLLEKAEFKICGKEALAL